ncbi:MAG: diacylglycerol kinase family lipid kinase [Bacteroidales bacterium]|nr:diacylglycerol kinase family lipid kinase [Bacteroidales bacterium]
METEKMMLIVNPISGVNSKEGLSDILVEKLTAKGFDVELAFTGAKGDATRLANEAVARGFGSVTVCGGDGTVNEAACALCGTGVTLGIIPSGSGNGLARHLGIPIDEMLSLDVIGARESIECDCGIANGKLFFCTFGMGFDATVSWKFATEKRRGRMTYIKNVMEEFGKYEPTTYTITADGQTFTRNAFLVACCNASQYGNNAFIAPEASITDGQLDLVIIESGNVLQMLLAGFDIISGMVPYNNHIETLRVKEVKIQPDCASSYAHIDGEPLQMDGSVEVRCLPKRLKVFAHDSNKQITPFITPIDLTLRDWGIAIGKLFRP